jgi:hypothetical protein
MAKIALITGVTGQDGSYLAEFLIKKGCEVHGVLRCTSSSATGPIDHLRKGFGTALFAAPNGSEGSLHLEIFPLCFKKPNVFLFCVSVDF